jgi:uncharacterized protein YraI
VRDNWKDEDERGPEGLGKPRITSGGREGWAYIRYVFQLDTSKATVVRAIYMHYVHIVVSVYNLMVLNTRE